MVTPYNRRRAVELSALRRFLAEFEAGQATASVSSLQLARSTAGEGWTWTAGITGKQAD